MFGEISDSHGRTHYFLGLGKENYETDKAKQ